MRVSARRSRKIQRRLRSEMLRIVSRHAASRRGQNCRGGAAHDPRAPKTRMVARRPTNSTADAEVRRRTQAMARGGRRTRDSVSISRTAIGSGAMVFPGGGRKRWALTNFANDVRRLVLRFVIGPCQEL